MPGGIRRRSAAAVATAALALSVLATPAPSTASAASTTGTLSAADDGERPSGERRGTYSFLSAPDLFNGDIGDARKAATWRTGMPNSWNEHWAANVENVFGQLASFRADDYLVAGDMVEGQWHRDRWNERVFGTGLPAVTRAGNLYYGEWNRFWRQAGVSPRRVHVAVGDHEVGDNLSRRGSVKYRAFSRFKDVFAANFTKPGGPFRYGKHPRTGQHRDTAYAAWLAKDVLLVTVDVFVQRTKRTEVAVDDDQLAWVKQVLRTTKRSDTVIVQGHVPVLGPVRTIASSGLTLKGGARSDFWRTLVKEKVDLYLAGEVHADTAIQRRKGEPVQVTHGGLAAYGATKFMTGDVAPDGTITLTSRRIAKDKKASVDPERRRIWGTARTLPWKQVLRPTSDVTGRLVLSPRGRVRSSEGNLEVNSFSGRPGENPSRPRGFPEEA